MENKNKKKSPLDRFKIYFEKDSFPEKYASPTAGQLKSHPLQDRIKNFFKDVVEAIKELLHEIL